MKINDKLERTQRATKLIPEVDNWDKLGMNTVVKVGW